MCWGRRSRGEGREEEKEEAEEEEEEDRRDKKDWKPEIYLLSSTKVPGTH